MAPDGFPLWVSEVEPGSVHDITAARLHALPALYPAAAAGLPALADPGYDGAGIGIHIPVKQPSGGRELDIDTRTRNALLRSLRCLGERGFALLTGRWRTLQHITASPCKIGDIARAALVLHPFRARLHQMKIAEITSVNISPQVTSRSAAAVIELAGRRFSISLRQEALARACNSQQRARRQGNRLGRPHLTLSGHTHLPRRDWLRSCCATSGRRSGSR